MALYVVQCRFQTTKDAEKVEGIAICSDADTPITFIDPDGKSYRGKDIWKYRLEHYYPWAKFDLNPSD